MNTSKPFTHIGNTINCAAWCGRYGEQTVRLRRTPKGWTDGLHRWPIGKGEVVSATTKPVYLVLDRDTIRPLTTEELREPFAQVVENAKVAVHYHEGQVAKALKEAEAAQKSLEKFDQESTGAKEPEDRQAPCERCQWNRLGCGEVEFALGTCKGFRALVCPEQTELSNIERILQEAIGPNGDRVSGVSSLVGPRTIDKVVDLVDRYARAEKRAMDESAFLGAQVEELQALVEKLEGRAATNDRNG